MDDKNIDAAAIKDWYEGVDKKVMAATKECPAAWGWNYRLGDDCYISEEDLDEIMLQSAGGTGQEAMGQTMVELYLVCTGELGERGKEAYQDIACGVNGGGADWIGDTVRDICEGGDEVYGTEFFPEDYNLTDLRELLETRPDLIDGSGLEEEYGHSRTLSVELTRAVIEWKDSGEREVVTFCNSDDPKLPSVQHELDESVFFYGLGHDDLVQMRRDGKTREDWQVVSVEEPCTLKVSDRSRGGDLSDIFARYSMTSASPERMDDSVNGIENRTER
ncbi:MAG: hypothetical protein Q4B30_06705 [Coriobacteriaceae bacterium]|nr:hypothetical protein [Coriobacteriaceae bacterium]